MYAVVFKCYLNLSIQVLSVVHFHLFMCFSLLILLGDPSGLAPTWPPVLGLF